MKVSYAQLTDLTGKAYRTLKKCMDGLKPVGVGSGGANLWDSKQALPLIYGIGKGTEEKLDAQAEKARLDKERADNMELKNAQLRGELIPLDVIKEESDRNAISIRNRFLAMPDRLAQMLETTSTFAERREVIDSEIRRALEALADGCVDV